MNQWNSTIYLRTDWKYIEKLEPKEFREYVVPNDEIERVLGLAQTEFRAQPDSMKTHRRWPIIVFYLSFRREPDRKVYKTQKYLFVFENLTKSGQAFLLDPDDSRGYVRDLKKMIEKLDTE